MAPTRRQGVYWLGTIPEASWQPVLPPGVSYVRGQLESPPAGYRHWQILIIFTRKVSLRGLKELFPAGAHYELSLSSAANAYVWKEDTRVPDSQFELGALPINRNKAEDWQRIWDIAKAGNIEEIPPDIRVRHYSTFRKIRADYAKPTPMERVGVIYWGPTATGKSRRAWDEAGMDAYPKNPRTKWWDGYQNQPNVVIDEFRGAIDIGYLLQWVDRYPVLVEIKGSTVPLVAKKFWLTSNIPPHLWFPDVDQVTQDALFRRFEIIEFS